MILHLRVTIRFCVCNQRHEFRPRGLFFPEYTVHRGASHDRWRPHASHCHTEMFPGCNHGHVVRSSRLPDLVGDLLDQSFLDLQFVSVFMGNSPEFRQAQDFPFGNVCNRDIAPEREQMMFTHAPHSHPGYYNHLICRLHFKQGIRGAGLVVDKFSPHLRHSFRRVDESGPFRVLTDCREQIADDAFNRVFHLSYPC